MALEERSITDVLQDIVRNVQDIIRSQVQLAKSEMLDELGKVKKAAPLLMIGSAATLLGAFILVWTVIFILAIVMPMWAATLIVGFVLCVVGVPILMGGLRMILRVDPIPKRTVATVKEDVEWIKEQAS